MLEIRKLNKEKELNDLLVVIQESFLTVAKDFNLTKENAPTNPAFITMDKLVEAIGNKLDFYVAAENNRIVGCIGIQPGKKEKEYYIERLAVLPEYRHFGYGKKLLDKAIDEIRKRNARYISIGIINENKVLKEWYSKNGFIEYETKKYDHLPFTVCLMGIDLEEDKKHK